jgi:hypothetical protein
MVKTGKINIELFLCKSFHQFFNLVGANHNFDHQPAVTLRRIDHSLPQQLSDCAAG